MIAVGMFSACTACIGTAQPGRSLVASGDGESGALMLELAPGTAQAVGKAGKLRHVRLLNDSRCPPDVHCVWAGDAAVLLEWTPASAANAQRFTLHTGTEPRTHTIGAWRFSLHALARGPAPSAVVQVERNAAAP